MSNTTGRIECRRADLLSALQTVCLVIPNWNKIPILANVRIRANKNTITVDATDCDVAVNVSIDRTDKNTKPVATTVPAKDLLAFCKATLSEDLGMEVRENDMSVHAGAARALPTLPPSDFPEDRKYKTPVRFWTDPGSLLSAINVVRPAISTEETRYYLNGMYFEPVGENMIKLVATDGHRLHTITTNADGITAESIPTRVIVPTLAIRVVAEILKKEMRDSKKSGYVAPTFFVEFGNRTGDDNPGGVTFHCGTMIVRSKIIDGTYPDYGRVIPTKRDDTRVATIDAKALDAAIKIAHLPKQRVGVKLSFNGGKLEVSSHSPDTGKTSSEVRCDFSGKLEIGFNGKYMRDAIAVLGNGNIEIEMTDAGAPAIWRAADANTVIVLMPMRV